MTKLLMWVAPVLDVHQTFHNTGLRQPCNTCILNRYLLSLGKVLSKTTLCSEHIVQDPILLKKIVSRI